jgi:two-component system, OmpR family, heavy metal sensor histidine kinase CusS
MSSKSALDNPNSAAYSARAEKTWSLAARLTVWYAGSAFALVLAATSFLYWRSMSNLDKNDDQVLGDRVRALQIVMLKRPGDIPSLRQEVFEEWEAHGRARIHMRVLDGDRHVVVESPGMSGLLAPSLFPPPTTEPDHGIDVTSEGIYRVLAVYAPDGSGHVIQVAVDRSVETELMADYRRTLLVVLGIAFIISTVAGYQIARRGIRPIHDITKTARHTGPANLSERITMTGLPAELLELADTFNVMVDRIEQSFIRLSRFSADIAHELRTPISCLRGEIEVALSKPRASEEYREALDSSLEECGRLGSLFDRMLFLARAENPETLVNKETCDVRTELTTVFEFYKLAAAEAGVEFAVSVEGELKADFDRLLFQRAVGNLVANALTHTPLGNAVALTATGDDTMTKVEVADTGCGIPATHLPHVFDRFFRVDQTRSSKNGSVGLGLAIVRSIVDVHGGTVEISSEVGQGTRVALIFPKEASQVRRLLSRGAGGGVRG